MSSSPHVVDLLDDYVHDLLGPQESDNVQSHCAGCAACAHALRQARRRLALMKSVPLAEPSADLVQETIAGVEARQKRASLLKRRFVRYSLAALAASVLLLAGSHVYYANLAPSNYDVVVLGQNELLAGSHASLRVRVMDRAKQKPVANAPVRVELRGYDGSKQTLATFKTDEQGAGNPRFDVPDLQGGQQLVVSTDVGWSSEGVTRQVTLKRSWKVMLSSDKPVYQPGQTIQLRALALRRPDLKPVGEHDAVFTLTDPKGNVLFKHRQPTSKFGITYGSCELASEILEGVYVVACQVGDVKSQMPVEVKRYVLPKFNVEVKPDRPFYGPGETAKITVQADYFFGKPVTKGSVEIKVMGEGEKPIETLKGTTDDKGKCEIKYVIPRKLAGTEREDGDARLAFAATVKDSAEQKQERSAARLITNRPVRVAVFPESGTLVRGVENVVYALVTRADGSPVPNARVVVNGDATADVKSDELGAASFTVTPTEDTVRWTIRASSRDGDEIARRHDRLRCGQAVNDFLVRTDRASYKAGQTMTLTALGAGVEPVFVDLIKDGQTLVSETVGLKDGKGEYQFDLPADVFGTIEMVAYRFGGNGLAARKRRIIYVSPADGLKIHATLDKGEYRPGRKANLNLSLTDDAGKPVAGAISLAAVDEAVFAVLAQRPGMESAFYNLEEELLKPVYAIYPWMPGEEKADRRDKALFASTSSLIGAERHSRIDRVEPDGQHTLAVNSFPEKQQQLAQLQARRMGLIWLGWTLLVLSAMVLGYVGLWLLLPIGQVLQIHVVGAIVLTGLVCCGIVTFILTGGALGAKRAAMMAENATLEKQAARAPAGGVLFEDAPRDGVLLNLPADRIEAVFVEGHIDPSQAVGIRGGESPPPRVRRLFVETLLWKPQLITDDAGKLPPLPIELADTITTWRLSASAVSGDGRLGAARLPMKVFQPFFVEFNLPVSLTRGDEVGVPVVVYNYLDKPQTVKLTLTEGKWFTLSGQPVQTIELKPKEVRSTRFTLKVNTVGVHKLLVTATAGEVGDAIEREIEVVPDGKKVEVAHSGTLDRPVSHTLSVPQNAIEGSVKAFVKIYPSSFSQLVEGLDAIFQMPSGCFEQTSSTTYPNVLALQYLKQTNQSSPKIEAKARQYVHLGYQRLVGFEVKGGGFDWFGNPPANVTLTAYGLMEFQDMAKVHDVDANMIARTRAWLLSKRHADGSWAAEAHALHDDVTGRDAKTATLGTTAYVAWAVFADARQGQGKEEARVTLDYLLSHSPRQIKNTHVLALVCNALLAMEPNGKDAAEYVTELLARRKEADGGKLAYWEPPAGDRMTFYGAGDSAKIETTAMAALALLASDQATAARPALSWLVTKKDARGTWHSTQATVLSLKALVTGTGKSLGGDAERRVTVKVGEQTQEVVIAADQAEVMKLIDVSKWLKAGDTDVSLTEKSKTAPGYQVVFRYHVPEPKADNKEPLSIAIDYDTDSLTVGETVKAEAAVTNRMKTTAPMVMVDLPVPPGFAPDAEAFAKLVKDNVIARYQVQARRVLVYLRALEPGKPLTLRYSLRATMPVRATAPAGRVYEYYDPQKEGFSPAKRFTVKARE